ncbi:pentapeptide repeat-containing protein [Agrobacterium larrymoorei]|nr:pentapeptide repeat-containing protein [Agrobacterium larrymoorei]NTJ41749.1 pentapeptide repeat-containing protein [Agrobacterium larrymoorei]
MANLSSKVSVLRRNMKLACGASMLAAVLLAVAGPAKAASCRADAVAAIDWTECNKRLLMLGGSVLDGATLKGTDFTYTDLRGSSFNKANFEKAKLIRTSLASSQLEGANLSKIEAYRSDFSDVNAENAVFLSAEMQRANFENAKLVNANFSKAELGRADFNGATLTGTKFSKTNLSRASFKGASFNGPIDFEDSFLLLTRIEGLDLSSATGLDQRQIDIACGDDKTKLPSGLTKPGNWPCPEDSEDE